MGKFCFFIPGIFFTSFLFPLFAQEMPVKEVAAVVVETNKKFFTDDHTASLITLKEGLSGQYRNIGDVLKKTSSLNIRNYGGAGSLVSVSMHGTGSNHTQVLWNGIPLNSPTTGQADLSMMPASFVQTIEIVNGASGSLFGSGTFGGAVSLENQPDWENRISARYMFTTGSFGSWGHTAGFSAGNSRLQFQLTAVRNHSQNSFSYKDHYRYNSPEIRNSHNTYNDAGVIQNLFLKLNKNSYLEAGAWYQQKSLEIPPLMGSYRPGLAIQKDSLFRSFISYRMKTLRYALMIRSAWVSDFLNYRDRNTADSPWALDSRISSSRFLNQADFRIFLTSKVISGGGIEYNHLSGKSNNYGGRVNENDFAVYGNVKYIHRKAIFNVGLRKEFYTGLNPEPQYSAGLRYMITRRLGVRSSFSTKFRKPTFNEKYWKPGGNPDLRPEKGKGGDLTVEWLPTPAEKNGNWMEAKVSAYYQSVDNWIQWVMLDSLTPVEYKKVHARGFETSVDFGISMGSLRVTNRLNYSFNLSTIAGTFDKNKSLEGNQLIYVPRNTFSVSSGMEYHGFFLDLFLGHTGKRETTETADPAFRLPAYTIFDVTAGFSKKINMLPVGLYFGIDNVFDKSYEIIRSYPLPGRSWHLSLTLGFSKLNS